MSHLRRDLGRWEDCSRDGQGLEHLVLTALELFSLLQRKGRFKGASFLSPTAQHVLTEMVESDFLEVLSILGPYSWKAECRT